MEQLSNILVYAQDCDAHVLEDLFTWLNDLVVRLRSLSRNECAEMAYTTALALESMIKQKNSEVNFAWGGTRARNAESKRRKHP